VLRLSAAPLPVATLVVGLWHVLMGAALAPVFSKLPRLKAYGSVFFMADENSALTIREFAKGRRDAAFLVGGGLLMFLAWTGSTFAGGALRGVVEDPSRSGLDGSSFPSGLGRG
jgi:predicted branched-subunit amino acid permease